MNTDDTLQATAKMNNAMMARISQSRRLKVADLSVHPELERRADYHGLETLKASIEDKGLINPITVASLAGDDSGRIYVVAGHRRYYACKKSEKLRESSVPVQLYPQTTLEMAKEIAKDENDEQSPMTIYDRAVEVRHVVTEGKVKRSVVASFFCIDEKMVDHLTLIAKLAEQSEVFRSVINQPQAVYFPKSVPEIFNKHDGARFERQAKEATSAGDTLAKTVALAKAAEVRELMQAILDGDKKAADLKRLLTATDSHPAKAQRSNIKQLLTITENGAVKVQARSLKATESIEAFRALETEFRTAAAELKREIAKKTKIAKLKSEHPKVKK